MTPRKSRKLPVDLRRPIRVQVIRPGGGLAVTDPGTVAKHNEDMIRAHEMAVAKERQRKLKLLKRYYKVDRKSTRLNSSH